MAEPSLIVVVGPTASGKTAFACGLAERLAGEIVSADSQQCYRGLDVGTAKPGAAERAQAPHHLLDVADPEEQLDAARFLALADAAIAAIRARGKQPIVAGGTGLWIRALLRGLLPAPSADPGFRAAFRADLAREGLPAMHARLLRADPAAAARIHATDQVRIERALEVFALTGRPLSELQREHAFKEQRYLAKVVHLDPPRELLKERIDARTRALFAESSPLWEEARELLSRIHRVPEAAKALKIIGYGEAAEVLQGATTREAACEAVMARTRQYAKRQRTWFTKEYGEGLWPPPSI